MTAIERLTSEFTSPKVGETVPEILERLSRATNGLAGLSLLTKIEMENILEDQGRVADIGAFCSCSTAIGVEGWSVDRIRYHIGSALDSACVDLHEAAATGLENVTVVAECLEQLVSELKAVAKLYEACDKDKTKYFELYIRELKHNRVRRSLGREG